jgi:predicted GH43/DUF377 family glycosyl hydrolase
MTKGLLYAVFIYSFLFNSCGESPIPSENFKSEFDDPSMICNHEKDNTIEGIYIEVSSAGDDFIKIKDDIDLNIIKKNTTQWTLGWGDQKPLFDAGSENLIEIIKIEDNKIVLGNIVRGDGRPETGQRIVFWNKEPSGFKQYNQTPIINPDWFNGVSGNSLGFGGIIFIPKHEKYFMFIYELNTVNKNIFIAESSNLIDWSPSNHGNPILSWSDFIDIEWCNRDACNTTSACPWITDVFSENDDCTFLITGYDKNHKQHLGFMKSNDPVNGNFIIDKLPSIEASSGDIRWYEKGCSSGKIIRINGKYKLFFSGISCNEEENVGTAVSTDLKNWTINNSPVITDHQGWRSAHYSSEPVFVSMYNNNIHLLICGAKELKQGWWHHYITRDMYMDKSGNVDDIQYGMYKSSDGGATFTAHSNNPVFCNDYSNPYENEHLGACFKMIKTDSADYIFYNAKSSEPDLHYNIMTRVRKKE